MRVLAYVHPERSILPVSGVGRHVNGMLLELSRRNYIDLELLHAFDRSFCRGSYSSPLVDFAKVRIGWPERLLERSWKAIGLPSVNRYGNGFDVLYSPAETLFPRSKTLPRFITLHDIYPLDPLYPDYEVTPRWGSQRRRWEHWVPKVFQNSSGVLTVSEFCKNRMQELIDVRDCPIHVIGNGVDPVFFDGSRLPVEECDKPGDWPYVLVVGGLTSRKGASQTLRVAEVLGQIGSEIRIVVVGRNETHWERVAAQYRNVVLCGPLPDERLVHYLRAASCLLFLSLYEGFGIPAIEAMACGTPAIVSDRSSLPEVAGDVAVVVDPDNSDQVAHVIESVCTDSSLRQSLCSKGFQRAAHFTWKACVDRLEKVFEETI